jgi:biopolymer transport protein ExbB
MQPTATVPTHGLEGQLLDVFLYLGSAWILYLLLFLSIISIAITIERIIHFARRRIDLDILRQDLNIRLARGEMDGVRQLVGASRSHVAAVVLQGIDALGRGAAAVEEVMAGATQVERLKMERGLAFLGTLGNNAPFIGLFGTVLGIIRAFRDLAANTIEGSSAVMAGIAEALVATAVGLLVALPAVAVFNALQRYVRSQVVASEAMTRIVLAHAKSRKE